MSLSQESRCWSSGRFAAANDVVVSNLIVSTPSKTNAYIYAYIAQRIQRRRGRRGRGQRPDRHVLGLAVFSILQLLSRYARHASCRSPHNGHGLRPGVAGGSVGGMLGATVFLGGQLAVHRRWYWWRHIPCCDGNNTGGNKAPHREVAATRGRWV
ncbi:hypothetical protein HDV63DRAFT_93004 [Trichoderma sp. SZMC 28014]